MDNRVTIRFNDSDYAKVKAASGSSKLSTYCRELILGRARKRTRKNNKYRSLPIDQFRAISSIANNLNQITRLAHQAKKADALDILPLIRSVELIREDIESLLSNDG